MTTSAKMQLRFSREELLSDHDYAIPHEIEGQKLHGGFDSDGNYIPPRSKIRPLAIENWSDALRERGGDLLDADSSLLTGPRVPNVRQQCLLIKEGMSKPFWNGLTITGKIEGRGRMLSTMPIPPLQDLIVEDISDMAIGHLGEGLMHAHGIDEGGEPEKGIGGHDAMWFVARDLVMGPNAHPDVDPPGSIAREETPTRRMPDLPLPLEMFLSFMMNLLLIEFRAEIGFKAAQDTMRAEGVFDVPREQAEEAAEIVERIRTDEKIHVESLRLYLGEFRSIHFRTEDGGEELGAKYIDPFWDGIVRWATVDQPRLVAGQAYQGMRATISEMEDSERVQREFDALSDADVPLAAG